MSNCTTFCIRNVGESVYVGQRTACLVSLGGSDRRALEGLRSTRKFAQYPIRVPLFRRLRRWDLHIAHVNYSFLDGHSEALFKATWLYDSANCEEKHKQSSAASSVCVLEQETYKILNKEVEYESGDIKMRVVLVRKWLSRRVFKGLKTTPPEMRQTLYWIFNEKLRSMRVLLIRSIVEFLIRIPRPWHHPAWKRNKAIEIHSRIP